MHAAPFAQAIAMIHAALRNGRPQPWMYEALVLAMQAAGNSKQETERALMSAVDFAETPEDLMYVAQYMARIGLEKRALEVFRQVSVLEPLRPEPYLYGLQLAQHTDDLDGIRWASLGILRQAWPKDKQSLVDSARARGGCRGRTTEDGKTRGRSRRVSGAARQGQASATASSRSLGPATPTSTSWSKSPSGSICSFRNPRTSDGGVMLGDSASREGQAAAEGVSETYVCPEAFNGTYRVLIRRVWGKVTAGKVTVDLYVHYGTKDEKHMRHQIPLGEEDQLVVFDLNDGRRNEALEEQQLANAAEGQMHVNQAILAQQMASLANPNNGGALLNGSRQNLLGLPVVRQQVGYQPVITALPSGTSLSVSGVVSADRRYVRISPFAVVQRRGLGDHVQYPERLDRHFARSGRRRHAARPGPAGRQPGHVPDHNAAALRWRTSPGKMSRSRFSTRPALRRSTAIAPITALSVQSRSGGMCSAMSRRAASAVSRSRRRPLAATPPPTHSTLEPVLFDGRAASWPPGNRPRPPESWPPGRPPSARRAATGAAALPAAKCDSARPSSAR